jgi:predicted CoA-binding protein
MTRKLDVDRFFSKKKLAVVGVSRQKYKFGNTVYYDLKKKGFRVFPVNAHMQTFDNERCFPDLKSLPEPIDGAVLVIPPAQTEQIVKDAAAANVPLIWMQQGSESKSAVQFCKEHNITTVTGECILMFAEPVAFFHKFHRWLNKLFGKLPK